MQKRLAAGRGVKFFDPASFNKAIPIKCFISHRPLLERLGRSVGRIKKNQKIISK